ncbi:MAG: carboxy-S-adenosyl-L-methionine synthase CmoA [Candidatus Omnitrophica bacterium]|nr:carboxy-S-adenosyl-L-methionine synthase CmoA [Candidatus Omnitrophota bacterium]
MPKDKIFNRKRRLVENFNFGKETSKVFDDMLHRSVPLYDEMQRMIREITAEFAVSGTNVYDLGCSTGNTFLAVEKGLPPDVTLIGVDSSKEMLAQAQAKFSKDRFSRKVKWLCHDLNKGIPVQNASVVIMNLTLQFIRPLYRQRAIASIASGLNEGGCLILIEKVLSPHSTLNRLFIKFYYEFKKRNGYSRLEISQKREALENVLVPYHFDENRELLLQNGFKGCDIFFRWYNFCGILALK